MAKPNLPEDGNEDGATQGATTEPESATPVPTVHEDPPPPYCVVAHLPSLPSTPLMAPPFAGHPLATMTPVASLPQAAQAAEAARRRSHLYLPLVPSSSLPASPGASPCCSNCMAASSSPSRPSCSPTVCEACTSAANTPTSETCTTCSTSRTTSTTASSCTNCRSAFATTATSPTRPALAWGGTVRLEAVRRVESSEIRHCNCNHAHSPVAISPATPAKTPAALPSPVAVEIAPASVPGQLAGALPERAPASDPAPASVPELAPDTASACSPAALTSAEIETAKPSVPSRQVSTVARNTLSSAVKLYSGLESEVAFPPLSSFRMLTWWQKRLLVFSIVWTALIIVAGILGCYFIAWTPDNRDTEDFFNHSWFNRVYQIQTEVSTQLEGISTIYDSHKV